MLDLYPSSPVEDRSLSHYHSLHTHSTIEQTYNVTVVYITLPRSHNPLTLTLEPIIVQFAAINYKLLLHTLEIKLYTQTFILLYKSIK